MQCFHHTSSFISVTHYFGNSIVGGGSNRTMNAFRASRCSCKRFSGFRVNDDCYTTSRTTTTMTGATPRRVITSKFFIISQSIRSFSSGSGTAANTEGNNGSRIVVEAKIKVDTSDFLSEEQELLLEQHKFERHSFLDIDYFNKLLKEGLCKKIDENFCQDNRDYKYSGKRINHDKEVLLNQTLDTELVHKGHRDPVYYAVKNGEVLALIARIRKSRYERKGEDIGRLPNGAMLERVVYVLNKSRNYGNNFVHLKNSIQGEDVTRMSSEKVGTIVLATFIGNRPHGLTVDHINGIRDNDRLENLRWATKAEQGLNKEYRSLTFPFSTMEETGYTYYQHPTHHHLFISESSFFIVCWNDKTKRFMRIYEWGKPIYKKTIGIDGKEYRVDQLIQEAHNNKKGVQLGRTNVSSSHNNIVDHAEQISKSSPFIFCWNDITKRFLRIYQWGKRNFLEKIDINGRNYPVDQQLIQEAQNSKKMVGHTNVSKSHNIVDQAKLIELLFPLYKTMKETGLTYSQHPKYSQIYYTTENTFSILCWNNNTKRFHRIIRWGKRIFSVNDRFRWKEIPRSTTTTTDSKK